MLNANQTLSQEAESAGMNREPVTSNGNSFTVLYTLADVFAKYHNQIEPIYHETLISRPTLRKALKQCTLDQTLFIRCPDGHIRSFVQKPASKYSNA